LGIEQPYTRGAFATHQAVAERNSGYHDESWLSYTSGDQTPGIYHGGWNFVYKFSLTVTSFWEPSLAVTAYYAVKAGGHKSAIMELCEAPGKRYLMVLVMSATSAAYS